MKKRKRTKPYERSERFVKKIYIYTYDGYIWDDFLSICKKENKKPDLILIDLIANFNKGMRVLKVSKGHENEKPSPPRVVLLKSDKPDAGRILKQGKGLDQ